MNPRVSIIIPARNDSAALGQTLAHLDTLPGMETAEIVVAASGDRDAAERVVGGRARLVWPDGSTRAALMNAGAALARGGILFFLHADSFPPTDALALIERAFGDPHVVGGAFEHRFTERQWALRAISWIDRCRYRLTRNYYGDQGMRIST